MCEHKPEVYHYSHLDLVVSILTAVSTIDLVCSYLAIAFAGTRWSWSLYRCMSLPVVSCNCAFVGAGALCSDPELPVFSLNNPELRRTLGTLHTQDDPSTLSRSRSADSNEHQASEGGNVASVVTGIGG